MAARQWEFLNPADRLRIDAPPIEFVQALELNFDAEALVELGLYERVGDELRLPSWLDGDAPFYVKVDREARTISFHRDSEFLFPMASTALDCALLRNPPESTQQPVTLYVVESQEAVELLQRLGLRAVSCEGLDTIGRDDVLRIFSGDHPSDLGWRYNMLLVGADVVQLENRQPAPIGDVIKRLADAADVYGIDPGRRFGVCRPSAREFRKFELAVSFADSAQICQLFEQWSAAATSVQGINWRTLVATEFVSFSAARAALDGALHHSNDLARRAQVLAALPAYRVAGKEAVIEKFYNAIDGASDPFDQVNLIAAADYATSFLNNDPLVRAGEAVLAGQTPPKSLELEEALELFEQRQRFMVELRRIQRDRRGKR